MHRLYSQGLRPLLEDAVATGAIAADADLDALITMLILVLTHLALAPFEPGLDSALPLFELPRDQRREQAQRLVAIVFASSLVAS